MQESREVLGKPIKRPTLTCIFDITEAESGSVEARMAKGNAQRHMSELLEVSLQMTRAT